jgi:hypothetical protein
MYYFLTNSKLFIMKKISFLVLALGYFTTLGFNQACEPGYNSYITLDETQGGINVWQCYSRAWNSGFANCPHDFTDCIAYRYDNSYDVENGQYDSEQLHWAFDDVNVRYIQMNRRKWVAFQGYVFDYLKVFINRWEPASHFGPSEPRQFCVPLSPSNNTINLLEVCYWQTQMDIDDDPVGMHWQPMQQLPNASFHQGKYGTVTNFSFYYLDGTNSEVPIANPMALDLTPFAVPSTSSPIYAIYCKWDVQVSFDNNTTQTITKSKPVFWFQCNSRPVIEENPLDPIVIDTIFNTDPVYDITPHIVFSTPGVISSWVLFPGEYASGSDLIFDPSTYSTISYTGSMIIQKISPTWCYSNAIVKPFTFIIDPGTPSTPEIISKRFYPTSYTGSNSLVATIAPWDNLLLSLQEQYAESEGIIGNPASNGVPAWVPPPGCFLCIAPYWNFASYSIYQRDSMGIVQRNSTHLCTDKTYALPVYNPSGSLTYEWESNRSGDYQMVHTGPTFNIMEPDSGVDRTYNVRVFAKNVLNHRGQPLTFTLNFHSNYKIPVGIKDSSCVDSSFLDNIPFASDFYLYRDSTAWSDIDFADSLNSYNTARNIFGNSHQFLVFDGADTIGYNTKDSLHIGNIAEGFHQFPVEITSYYPYRQRNEPDNISPVVNGFFDLANNGNEDNPHPLGIPAYDFGCVCKSYDTITVIGKPEVNVTYALPDSVDQGYSTVFTTTANNPNLDYVWLFSDEGVSYASDPLHYFYDIGPQSFNLTVTDAYGCSSVITHNDITYVDIAYIGIEEIENDFSIFPNPSQDYIYIQSASESGYAVKLYNSMGQILFAGTNASVIDLTTFSAGIYSLEISVDGIQKVYKIIKSNSNY